MLPTIAEVVDRQLDAMEFIFVTVEQLAARVALVVVEESSLETSLGPQ